MWASVYMTTVFLLPAESFYWLGLPLLPQAQLSERNTPLQQKCCHKKHNHKGLQACTSGQLYTHTTKKKNDFHWQVSLLCKDKTHTERMVASGHTFSSCCFSSTEIIPPKSQTKPEITEQWPQRQPDTQNLHTYIVYLYVSWTLEAEVVIGT